MHKQGNKVKGKVKGVLVWDVMIRHGAMEPELNRPWPRYPCTLTIMAD